MCLGLHCNLFKTPDHWCSLRSCTLTWSMPCLVHIGHRAAPCSVVLSPAKPLCGNECCFALWGDIHPLYTLCQEVRLGSSSAGEELEVGQFPGLGLEGEKQGRPLVPMKICNNRASERCFYPCLIGEERAVFFVTWRSALSFLALYCSLCRRRDSCSLHQRPLQCHPTLVFALVYFRLLL